MRKGKEGALPPPQLARVQPQTYPRSSPCPSELIETSRFHLESSDRPITLFRKTNGEGLVRQSGITFLIMLSKMVYFLSNKGNKFVAS